jgi:hypothetical protein
MTRITRGPQWVIGWREWIGFPDLEIDRVKAKIDTGARTSALHAYDVERFRRRGRDFVRFVVHPLQRNVRETVRVEAELRDERRVKNSGGGVELRPVIRTRAQLRGRIWPIELTLTNRDEMGFRLLLGREALRGRFLLDPGRSFLTGRPPKARGRSSRGGS